MKTLYSESIVYVKILKEKEKWSIKKLISCF
jgi:hypothetical protein